MSIPVAISKKQSAISVAGGKSHAAQSSRVSSLLTRQRLQVKSLHSNPADEYEQEAERVARAVIQNQPLNASNRTQPVSISRLPLHNAATENTSNAHSVATSAQQAVVTQILHNKGGRALAQPVRDFFENRFQQDFSAVRIHADTTAHELCNRIQAQAFTYGNSIYFRAGQYQPDHSQGRLLLAHELTHVVQQGRADSLQRKAIADAGGGAELAQENDLAPVAEDNSTTQPSVSDPTDPLETQQQEQALSSLQREPDQATQQPVNDSEVEVELPPEQTSVEQEQIAPVETLNMEGTSDQALLAFSAASPSSMALAQPTLASTLDTKLAQETTQESEAAPTLNARTSGEQEIPQETTQTIASATEFQPQDTAAANDEQPQTAEQHQNNAALPDNSATNQLIEKPPSGGFLDWFRSNFSSYLSHIQTRDKGLDTSAGQRLRVQLDGNADPSRAARTGTESTATLNQQREQTSNTLRDHPGQSNIQPKEVDQAATATLKNEKTVAITQPEDQGMADYAAMPLPEAVRAKSDELLQPSITSNLTETRKQTQQAASARQSDKQREITSAEAATAELNRSAQRTQNRIVLDNRKQVADQQRQGITEANNYVSEFTQAAGTQQSGLTSDIKTTLKQSEQSADQELQKGEAQAEQKRKQEEAKADSKKQQLETEQQSKSWWDRAVDAVKSAVKSITSAIDKIFSALRQAVKDIIDRAKNLAIGLINKARAVIIEKLNDFRDWAKKQVNTYLKDTFPALATRINNAIDKTVDIAVKGVNAVADGLITAVEAVASVLAAALDKILATFQAALKAVVQITGALLTGDFAEALRIAIRAACDIAGIDSKPIFDFIDRAAGAISKILKDPVGFFMNIVKGVGGGIRNFAKNIKKHLINGLLGWLTGALSEVPVTLPEKFDFKGILNLSLQILGLTYDNIKARVIKKFPPAASVFNAVETGVDIIRRIVTEGPIAIWEMVKESINNLKEMVLGGIRNFVIVTVVKEAVGWLIGLLNPAGALVKVVKLLFDFSLFLIERFQQIKDFILSVYSTITAIASGQLGKVMSAVEAAMSRSLPVVISLLASLAGLGGIGKTIQNIIRKISKPVNKVIDRIIDKVISFAQKLLGKDKKGDKASKDDKKAGLGAVTLADLNQKPVPAKRSAAEKKQHLQRVHQLLGLISKTASNTDDIEQHFPKIKQRYRLQKLEYDKAGTQKIGIRVKINPEQVFTDFPSTLEVKSEDGKEAISQSEVDKPEVTTSPLTVRRNGKDYQNTVGIKMKAPFLTPKHPAGSDTSGSELAELFKVLPTNKDYPAGYRANQVYIRGHLLNANLGGKAEDRNLFPITQKANSDHHNLVESQAKKLVNEKGLLVSYEVDVKSPKAFEKNGFTYVNSTFDCKLATYTLSKGKLLPNKKALSVAIKSTFEVDEKTPDKVKLPETGVQQKDFDPSQVKTASNASHRYLSDISATELQSITGIDKTKASAISNAAAQNKIRTFDNLKSKLSSEQYQKLQSAKGSFRLYHK